MAFQVEASFLSVRIVLESLPFGPRLFRSFLSKERIMAQKYFREIGNFGQHVPRHQSKMISRYRDLGILFCSWKRFGRFETASKSWCVPNYQMSVFFKNSSFLLPDFRRIRESFWIRHFKANCLSRRDQKVYSVFSKSCPSGHQSFQQIPKWKKVLVEMGLLPTVITNSFRILVIQKFENIFNHNFLLSFALGLVLFLLATTKFIMTKDV